MCTNLKIMHFQDLFAELRPNMTRYASIEEANAALLELDEHERTVSTEKANSEKHSDRDRSSSRVTSDIPANGQSLTNGTEENGELHEEMMGDSESDSGSHTTEHPGRDDDDEFDEENRDDGSESEDEYDDGDGPASDEDDEVHVRSKVAEVDPLEEADFERELRALMQASTRTYRKEDDVL